MGTLILIIAFFVEAGFAAYCIATKSNQRRVRSFIRVGALAAFVLFTLVSVIQWGFRWYLLALLLLVWGVVGSVGLARAKEDTRSFGTGRSVLRGVLALLLVFVAVIPALIFPQVALPKMTGKHEVATVQYSYTNEALVESFAQTGEKRTVNVEFWYPKDVGGTYPLIVFSHGAFGIKTSNTSTFMNLASNGYVVCSIDHPYHSLFTRSASGRMITADRSFLHEVTGVNGGQYDEATIYALEQKWMKVRVSDIQFLLDTILAKTKSKGSDEVYRLIDPQKIGLIGHSLGGASAAQVARERHDVGAVINLDGDLLGEYVGFVDGNRVLNSTPFPVPLLTIYSDSTVRLIDAVPDANELVAVKHVSTTAPHAYEIQLDGTDHMSLTDVPLVSPFLVSIINRSSPKAAGVEKDRYGTIAKMNDIVLEFFNAYVKGQGGSSRFR